MEGWGGVGRGLEGGGPQNRAVRQRDKKQNGARGASRASGASDGEKGDRAGKKRALRFGPLRLGGTGILEQT